MTRRSFVQINGKLYEKTGHNSAIIAGELWTCVAGSWAPSGSHCDPGVMVMPDITPYKSMIDGSVIQSRSEHRAHLRAHGCVEMGNERLKPRPPEFTATRGLREELIARING